MKNFKRLGANIKIHHIFGRTIPTKCIPVTPPPHTQLWGWIYIMLSVVDDMLTYNQKLENSTFAYPLKWNRPS